MTERDRAAAMRAVQTYAFAMKETELYLDCHPDCAEALDYYARATDAYRKAKERYESAYGALTSDGAATKSWGWSTEPFPWEV